MQIEYNTRKKGKKRSLCFRPFPPPMGNKENIFMFSMRATSNSIILHDRLNLTTGKGWFLTSFMVEYKVATFEY